MAFRTPLALSTLALAAMHAAAQQADPQTAQQAAQSVTISGRGSAGTAGVAGFGDIPLGRLPLSATTLGGTLLTDANLSSLADLARLDASVSDAYNAPGYWSMLSVRGYALDNRYNYRRDGLPINAETALALDNKAGIELMKGLSGLQAGTSAPGGLVNLVVKRPAAAVRAASLEWEQERSLTGTLDIGDRAGADGAFGWRVNAAYGHLDPRYRSLDGQRHLLAVATDWRLGRGALLEAEVEHSHHSQPSLPGLSLLGQRVPDAHAIDPRLNLNNQPWSLPVVLDGDTASVRYSQPMGAAHTLTAHAMSQRLTSDDRVAFPYGCSAEELWDRYCSDGSFDLYDFRSEGERRRTDALDIALGGRAVLAGMEHRYGAGLLVTRHEARFNRQAYNWVGTGTLDATTATPADPTLTDENTQRTERTTEWRLHDAMALNAATRLWAGLRRTALRRESVRTDGSRATGYEQAFTTPWLALSHQLTPQGMLYASWGQGVESEVAPNRSRYTNAGQALPALKSRQAELGYKHRNGQLDAGIALFDITRPVWSDIGSCDEPLTCTRRLDGNAHHRGLEAEIEWRTGAWNLRAGALLLRARRTGAADAGTRGLRPTNVPERTLKLQATYAVPALPGLALVGLLTAEGDRAVLPDNSQRIGGWARADATVRYTHKAHGHTLTWRAGADNLANRRAWKEAPYQFGHAYLYPLPARTLRASLSAEF